MENSKKSYNFSGPAIVDIESMTTYDKNMNDVRFIDEAEALQKSALAISYRVGENELISTFSEKIATFFQSVSPYIETSNPESLSRINKYLGDIQMALSQENYVKLADIVLFDTGHCLDGLKNENP